MKKLEQVRAHTVAAALAVATLATPGPVSAHPGHGEGDHGWLLGAVQPFLSWDHLAAGVFVLGVGAAGMAVVGRVRARGGKPERV